MEAVPAGRRRGWEPEGFEQHGEEEGVAVGSPWVQVSPVAVGE